MPNRDDDPPELRRQLSASPAVVAESAMWLAWKVERDLGELDNRVSDVDKALTFTNHQVRLVNARVDNLEGRIIASLSRIEVRLGTVEKRPPVEVVTEPELPQTESDRPISYHDLPNAIEAVERQRSATFWLGLVDAFKGVFREGLRKGAASAVAALVVAAALLAAGYAIRDCSHAIVHQGQSPEIPKLKPLSE
jgi:hypothetical protein